MNRIFDAARKPRQIVMFTPLPPRKNGIADYAGEVLSGLLSEYELVVVVGNEQETPYPIAGVTIITYAEYVLNEDIYETGLHIYQVGNNPDHLYMLPVMAERPGIVVLHDPSLHHLADQATVASRDFDGYADAMEVEHGVVGRVLGEQYKKYQVRETRMFYDLPMIRGLVGPSLGVIVHSGYAALKVIARAPGANVVIAPHQYSPPEPETLAEASEVRESLGVSPSEILFMSLGFVTRAKCIDRALRALSSIRHLLPDFKYAIVGEIRKEEFDVERLVEELDLAGNVVLLGYVDEQDFFSLTRAADVVINLRYPIGGETSGAMIRALGAGACTVVVDRGPFAEIPSNAAIRVPWNDEFDERLAEELLRLGRAPEVRRRIGQHAARFIAENNNLLQTVDAYKRAIAGARPRGDDVWFTKRMWWTPPAHELRRMVSGALRDGGGPLPLWFRAGIVPVQHEPLRVVAIGAGERDFALLRLLGYAEVRAVETIAGAGEERRADLVLVFGLFVSEDDLRAGLGAANYRLSFGGRVVWYSKRSAGDADGDPLQVLRPGSRLFEAFGFRVDASISAGPPTPDEEDDAVDGGQEERCWRATKVSDTFCVTDLHAYAAALVADTHQSVLGDPA